MQTKIYIFFFCNLNRIWFNALAQKNGCAMGSPQPPIVADLYIEEVKEDLKLTHPRKTLKGYPTPYCISSIYLN